MRPHSRFGSIVVEVVGSAAVCGFALAAELVISRRRAAPGVHP